MLMDNQKGKKTAGICETQPITAEGFRAMLLASPDLEFLRAVNSLSAATELIRRQPPDVLVVDKAFGTQAVLHWMSEQRLADVTIALVIWGNSITEPEALRFLQCGVKGIVRKTSDPNTLLNCIRVVASGATWMEDSLFRESGRLERYPRSELTPREQQVLELVEQGMKNREIARELGIRPGTVKIHLKHIFEKTGVRGRYGLALSGLREKGLLELSHTGV